MKNDTTNPISGESVALRGRSSASGCHIFCLVVLILMTGCVNTETEVVEDYAHSRYCMQERDNLGEKVVEADVPLELFVFDPCRQTSREFVSSACSVDVDGNVLNVSSRFVYQYETHGFGGDTVERLDCGVHVARCEVPALSAGDYEIVQGGESREFSLPSEVNLDCWRDIYFQRIE